MAVDEKRFNALGQEWVSRFDFNAICDIEEEDGVPFLSIVAPLLSLFGTKADADDPAVAVQAASAIKFSEVRKILYFSLRSHHPDVSPQQAGLIIEDIGFAGVMPIVTWAIMKAIPAKQGNVKRGRAKSA